jgi:hypothetical protein
MTGCYLTDLPRQFMRGMADFEPDYASNYFIPRETVKPALSLRQRVWPQVSLTRQRSWSRTWQQAASWSSLTIKLRDVFLQDSVFLRRDHPHHPLFCEPVFASPEYASFATAVLAAADTVRHEDPHLVAIEKAIPSVNVRAATEYDRCGTDWAGGSRGRSSPDEELPGRALWEARRLPHRLIQPDVHAWQE